MLISDLIFLMMMKDPLYSDWSYKDLDSELSFKTEWTKRICLGCFSLWE